MNTEKIKNRIREVAFDMFLENGYKKTKTDDLAKEAGISKRTLYEVYSSKKAILEEIINEEISKHIKEIEAIVYRLENVKDVNFLDELKNLWELHSESTYHWNDRLMLEIQTLHPDMWDRIEKFDENESKCHFKKILKAGKELGMIKKSADVDLVYLLEVTTMRHILSPGKLAELPYTLREIVAKLNNILFTGILSKNAVKEYKDKFKKITYKEND